MNENSLILTELTEDSTFNQVSLIYEEINVMAMMNRVKNSRAGAISSFFGTTRDNFEGKSVKYLEYEAYNEMALSMMMEICNKARKNWNLVNICMEHKLGPCPILDISVGICISSEHRKDSLKAVEFCIDELKQLVPIWKKEHYEQGGANWKENIIVQES